MKKLFVFSLLIILMSRAWSQTDRKIYFLADTINIAKANQVLKIETLNAFERQFVLFCKCTPPYKDNTAFYYIVKNGEKKTPIEFQKPSYPYVSFKDLMDILSENKGFLSSMYELYITEVLPGNQYRTNKVLQVPRRAPIVDHIILNEKN